MFFVIESKSKPRIMWDLQEDEDDKEPVSMTTHSKICKEKEEKLQTSCDQVEFQYPIDNRMKWHGRKMNGRSRHKLLLKAIHFAHLHDLKSMDQKYESRKCKKCCGNHYKWKLGGEVYSFFVYEPAEIWYMFCLNCGKVNASIYC